MNKVVYMDQVVEKDKIIDTRFWEYHKNNPEIYRLFKQYAHDARAAGFDRYSARAIIHRIRWHVNIETRQTDGFKISNDFTPRYARMLIAEDLSFINFFTLRRLTTYSSLSRVDEFKARFLNDA